MKLIIEHVHCGVARRRFTPDSRSHPGSHKVSALLASRHASKQSMKTIITAIIALFFLIPCYADEGIETTELLVIAKQIRAELRLLDALADHAAIANNQPEGAILPAALLREALAERTLIAKTPPIRLSLVLERPDGPADLLGNSYGLFIVGGTPHLHPKTFELLADTAPPGFWGIYAPAK
jgi:hypothetical protein